MRDSPAKLFDDAELDALAIPPEVRPSAWADEHRRLPEGSPAGNRWRNAHSPALAVLMDIIVRDTVHEVWIKKCVQAGVSTMAQCVVGWYADRHPCTTLVILPNKELGLRQIVKDWRPMFRLCAPLKAKATGVRGDSKMMLTKLINGFEMHLAYSGSVSSLAAIPVKVLVPDEVDKWEGFDGKEANPIELARMRQTKFLDKGAKLIGLSTPTTSDGTIAIESSACSIKIDYAVPCPHCGQHQVLHQNAMRWAPPLEGELPSEHGERVKFNRAAWFECVHCHERIEQEHKRQMVLAGRWQTPKETWCVYYDGREEGQQPQGVKIGVKYPAFYDLDIGWHHIAAETIDAGRDPAKLLMVTTQRYAEEFKFQEVSQPANLFADRCRPDPETGFVPFPRTLLQPWVMRLLLTVDTQKSGFWWVLRGWGYGQRSHRVAHGQATSFEQIEELLYRSRWPFAAGVRREPLGIYRAGIDSGGGIQGGGEETDRVAITHKVYQWCETDPVNRLALKGNPKKQSTMVRSTRSLYVSRDEKITPYERTVYLVDGAEARDLLASQIVNKLPVVDRATGELIEVDQWSLNDQNDFTYNQHLSSVKKVRKPKRGGGTVVLWEAEGGARHDYHDCEAYQIAVGIGLMFCTGLQSEELMEAEAQQRAAIAANTKRPQGIPLPSGRPWGGR